MLQRWVVVAISATLIVGCASPRLPAFANPPPVDAGQDAGAGSGEDSGPDSHAAKR